MFNKKLIVMSFAGIFGFITGCVDSSKNDDIESTSIEVITDDLNFSPH